MISSVGGARAYDDRCLSWNYGTQTVSIWTLDGRIRNVCRCGTYQRIREAIRAGADATE
ncbi:hypothetical protein [Saccharopolyspora shandongensis]|uniref:hypothetical protein n=1 Tax=Saccharopolyspora shandongensis TaxID=418495 RepID=UPI003411E992